MRQPRKETHGQERIIQFLKASKRCFDYIFNTKCKGRAVSKFVPKENICTVRKARSPFKISKIHFLKGFLYRLWNSLIPEK